MIKLEKKQGIATVTLNRVEKQNALSFTMFVELNKVIKNIKSLVERNTWLQSSCFKSCDDRANQ